MLETRNCDQWARDLIARSGAAGASGLQNSDSSNETQVYYREVCRVEGRG